MNEKRNQPKRHHWWPQVQSQFWTNVEGHVHVTRRDGTFFKTNPINIGVESELYTRFLENGEKDTSIEEWFAEEIDGPTRSIIDYICNQSNILYREFRGDPAEVEKCKKVGFRVNNRIAYYILSDEMRTSIAKYVSALLVRNPKYLNMLILFHKNNESEIFIKNIALDNMIYLFNLYESVIKKSVIMLVKRDGDSEFIFSDGGVVAQEPWRKGHGIPFDIHAPLTPDIAIQVLPVPFANKDLSVATLSHMTNQGIARMNRIVLGSATRFVFSRQTPPNKFIAKYFGIPAPKNIGFRIIDGRLETKFDPKHA